MARPTAAAIDSVARQFGLIFGGLTNTGNDGTYTVSQIDGRQGFYIGKDSSAAACLLIEVERGASRPPRIKLENLDVQFGIRATVRHRDQASEGTFTIIRCRSLEPDVIDYFFSITQTIVTLLRDDSTEADIARAVNRLALIFQSLQEPAMRSVYGLLGELMVIRESHNPFASVASWRAQSSSRFDFALGNVRMDAKATSGRVRVHSLSYDQCNPAPGTIAILASMFVERIDGGPALGAIVDDIERLVASDANLVVKIREIVAQTLGSTLAESLRLRFDVDLARSSLRFFDLRQIPGIRGGLPPGVVDVHFRSDLSASQNIALAELRARDPALVDLLPTGR